MELAAPALVGIDVLVDRFMRHAHGRAVREHKGKPLRYLLGREFLHEHRLHLGAQRFVRQLRRLACLPAALEITTVRLNGAVASLGRAIARQLPRYRANGTLHLQGNLCRRVTQLKKRLDFHALKSAKMGVGHRVSWLRRLLS